MPRRAGPTTQTVPTTIQLLPRLATLGLDLLSRHRALTAGSDGLARSAAACTITTSRTTG